MSFQLAPKTFWLAELISQFFCSSNSSKNITCPSGKLKTEFTSLIAKSTSPGLSDTTFFACCSGLIKGKIKIKNNNKKNCSFVLARYCLLRGSCAGLPTPFSLTYFKMANAASPSDYSSLKHAITMGCSTSHGLSNSTFVTPWDCKCTVDVNINFVLSLLIQIQVVYGRTQVALDFLSNSLFDFQENVHKNILANLWTLL